MGRRERIVMATGLTVAVVAGAGAGWFESVDVQSVLFALSSLGWVSATGIMSLRHAANSEFMAAAGFLILTIAEMLLWVSGRPGDPGYETGFAGGVMFYVPGLLLIAAPSVYHWTIRVFAVLGAGVWAAASAGYLTGSEFAHSDPLALAGYTLLSVAFIGIAAAVVRRDPPHSTPVPVSRSYATLMAGRSS